MEVVATCPLGHVCEDARDGKLYRCRWYVRLAGQHPQTGEQVDTWDCSLSWLPLVTVDVARRTFGAQAAVVDLKNEVVVQQERFTAAVAAGMQRRLAAGGA